MKKSLYTCITLVGFILLTVDGNSQQAKVIDPGGGGTPPPDPVTTITVSTNTCGEKTLTRSSNPPGGVLWYWQIDGNGTSKVNYSNTFVVSQEGTRLIGLRAFRPSNNMWGGAMYAWVTVNLSPPAPSTPTVSDQCGQSIITRGTPPSTPSGTAWYWQGTNANGTSTGNSDATFTAMASGSYYLRAGTPAGCWSNSVGVYVSFKPAPTTPPDPIPSGNTCGPVTLSFNGSPAANTIWYWQSSPTGTSTALGSANPRTVTSSGTYYLRAYSTVNGCWSPEAGEVNVTVNSIPPPPSTPSVVNECGSSIVSYSNSTGDVWYWQGTNADGESTENSATTYTATTSGTYYLRARSSAGCWSNSTSISVTVLSKPATPPTPQASGNTCGPVTLSFNGTPPADVRWYWQTSLTGTSTYAGYASPKTVTVTGDYYLRAYNTGSECWSDLSSGPVSVTYNPEVGLPSAAGETREEPGVVRLSASIGANGTSVRWYDAASGGNIISEATSFSPVTSATTNYYVSSYNASSGCESARVAVTATVNPKPVIGYTSMYIVMGNSVILSVANNTYTTYSWTKDGVSAGSTPTIAVTEPGTYAVSVTKTGMTGTGTSEPLTIAVADMNSIAATTVRKEGVALTSSIPALAANEAAKVTRYAGGLGNPIQTIISKGSPLQNDVIAPIEYDVMGRPLKGYLPYVSASDNSAYRAQALNNEGYTGSEQFQFYQSTIGVAHDQEPFTITEVEASPLGRTLSQAGVGSDWHSNGKKTTRQYLLNRKTDGVRIWTVSGGLPVSTATYDDYDLYVDLTVDEDNNYAKMWIDKSGRTVLKAVEAAAGEWLRTYYVYDDKGRLAFTLSPEATRLSNLSPNQAFLGQWAFQYKYDALDRVVEYKAPAGGWIYTVYDILDRPVLTQNADQRTRAEWMFVKYDNHGRPVVTGMKVISGSTRQGVQASVDGQSDNFEGIATSAIGYTLDKTYPTANEAEVISVNYYDNYAFLGYSGWDAEAHSFAFVSELGSTAYETAVNSLPTGAKIRIVNSDTWLNAVQYYDRYYRPLQVISENHLGGLDRNTNYYDELRQLSETRFSHHNAAVIVHKKFQYDHAGRIKQIFQNINNAPTDQLVAQYEYNALGQLIDKKLHNTTGTAFLQSVDYRYNIRGWVSSINNAQLNQSSVNDDTDDYFGMEFSYNTVESGLANTQYYNGNISSVKWKGFGETAGAAEQQSYKYDYDKAGRLLNATSQRHTGSAWTKETGALNESVLYDHNGNLQTLQRNHRKHQLTGTLPGYVAEMVDDLTYTYSATQGNQLLKVEDAVSTDTGTGDFKNNASIASEYTYNADGNLTADENKGIEAVDYNVLGKVSRIEFSNGKIITYLYDAGGNKLQMKTTLGSAVHTTDYVGGFVYVDGALSFFGSPEGRVVKKGSGFEYQYAIGDHQGNTRLMFTSATPEPEGPTATFEGNSSDDSGEYANVDPNFVVTSFAANHTTSGGKVVKMNQSYPIGPSKSLAVYPGDQVDFEVWEYHEGSAGFGSTSPALTTLISMVSGVFGGTSGGVGESGMIYDGVEEAFSTFGAGANQGDSRPAAYLNFIVFDRNYKVLDAGWQLAPAATFTKQKISFPTMNIEEPGFVYVWLSYEDESNNLVFFDDLKVTHTKSRVLQYNEYYPFGLETAGSWTREDSGNDFLYNSGNELNRNTGWYETFFRGYDPALGRFHQVDPLATAASSHTPYNYAFNDPVLFNDPNGDYPPGTLETLRGGGSGGLYSLGISGAHGGSYTSIMKASGNHWSDGFTNSDWTWNGGSPSYKAGLAAGMTDIGGTLYHINGDGSRSALTESNGGYGYYQTYVTGTGYFDVTFGERFVGLAQQGGPSPWEVGWEWLTGDGPRHRDFTNGDQFTEMLRQHDHVAATRGIILGRIANSGKLTGSNPYSLSGIQGVGKYLKDYSTLLTGGTTGNLAVTYLGSYVLNWEVTAINGNLATVLFTVNNSSTIQSATRPPVLGYTDAWKNTVGSWLNNQLSSGPMSQTTQTFRWTETITIK